MSPKSIHQGALMVPSLGIGHTCVVESLSTTKLDKSKAFASRRCSNSAISLASMAKPSPTGLEYALISEP